MNLQIRLLHAIALVILLAASAPFTFAQESTKQPASRPYVVHDESWIRDIDENAPCKFGPTFERISQHKYDPRIAFIEVSP